MSDMPTITTFDELNDFVASRIDSNDECEGDLTKDALRDMRYCTINFRQHGKLSGRVEGDATDGNYTVVIQLAHNWQERFDCYIRFRVPSDLVTVFSMTVSQ
jgi:hypothetical protein